MAFLIQRKGEQLHFLCLLVTAVLTGAVLFYAVFMNDGAFVNTESKQVGFFTICLWSEENENFTCPQHLKDLEGLGVISPQGVIYGSVFAYATLPMYLFVILALVFAWWGHCRTTLMVALGLLAISYLSLSIGIGTFLLCARVLVDVSELGYGFVTLILADVMLLIQVVATLHFLSWFKEEENLEVKV